MFSTKKISIGVMVSFITLGGCYFSDIFCDKLSAYAYLNSSDSKQAVKGISVIQSKLNLSKQTYLQYRKGSAYLNEYESITNINSIILIEQSSKYKSHAKMFVLRKNKESQWEEVLRCDAYLGRNGIDKIKEGDCKTPSGDYGVTVAFGIKDKPDTKLEYIKVNDSMYCCGDREFYNKIIDLKKVNHICSENSEHLIKYRPQYNYCLFLDYNNEGTFGKGSAIFLHCNGSYDYTLGCISVKEEDMLVVMKNIDAKVRICIYPYEENRDERNDENKK